MKSKEAKLLPKFSERKPHVLKKTLLQLPKSISALATYPNHLCCHSSVATKRKRRGKQKDLQSVTIDSNMTSYEWDKRRSGVPDPFVCCLFSAMVRGECENLAKHLKKKSSSLEFRHPPPDGGKHPPREIRVSDCLPFTKKEKKKKR